MNDAEFRRRAHALLTLVRPHVAGYPIFCPYHKPMSSGECPPTCEFVVLLAAGADGGKPVTCPRGCGRPAYRPVLFCLECLGRPEMKALANEYEMALAEIAALRAQLAKADPPPSAPDQVTSPQR